MRSGGPRGPLAVLVADGSSCGVERGPGSVLGPAVFYAEHPGLATCRSRQRPAVGDA